LNVITKDGAGAGSVTPVAGWRSIKHALVSKTLVKIWTVRALARDLRRELVFQLGEGWLQFQTAGACDDIRDVSPGALDIR
jgi:hypothetical protein